MLHINAFTLRTSSLAFSLLFKFLFIYKLLFLLFIPAHYMITQKIGNSIRNRGLVCFSDKIDSWHLLFFLFNNLMYGFCNTKTNYNKINNCKYI